ncbi:hypothetical protein EJ03DRAFT_6933 [Teratosphaeria nubilosa]|uniref:Uncharacterized protein n=1 Tax=Teratosphaeria nubilosa TaxID=161662 RepID=A0A6G1LN94_9PEZI|nr:hypothetical protein EJ03DRAFT_6933 [Teratosphaeria nubilosa]
MTDVHMTDESTDTRWRGHNCGNTTTVPTYVSNVYIPTYRQACRTTTLRTCALSKHAGAFLSPGFTRNGRPSSHASYSCARETARLNMLVGPLRATLRWHSPQRAHGVTVQRRSRQIRAVSFSFAPSSVRSNQHRMDGFSYDLVDGGGVASWCLLCLALVCRGGRRRRAFCALGFMALDLLALDEDWLTRVRMRGKGWS